MVNAANKIVHFGWKKEAIPYLVSKKPYFQGFLKKFLVNICFFRNISCFKLSELFKYNLSMLETCQKTIKETISFKGVGLHSGLFSTVKIFQQKKIKASLVDLKENNLINANFVNVKSTKLCTSLENNYGKSIYSRAFTCSNLYLRDR